jgi:hypothetical protein
MFPDFNEMKERIRRSLSKRSYSYRPLALLEQRRQNISHSSFSSTKQQPQQGTASFRNLLKVITEDEDDALGTSPIGGKDEEENLMNSHLLQSEMTPLNINAINQHHQSHLYHAINYQFIQLMSRSSSHHSPPFSLFQLPSSLPPSQRITAEDIADTDLGAKNPNDALDKGLLGIPRAHDLADGEIHLVRIAYFSDLRAEYLNYLVASESLLPYLLDNGDQKRIGTLVVCIDDGVANDVPLMAMPINLSLLLDLPTDKAFVGFTSSTGRFFEKHDLLSWYFCNEEPCVFDHKLAFDYHQQSKYFSSATLRASVQGPGYIGGGNEDGFPSHHTSPNTDPWEEPMQHFSTKRNIGLSSVGAQQVPPNTYFRT